MFAGIDVAVADAVLQLDAPLPSGLAGGGAGVRRQRRVGAALGDDGAVAGQPVRPVLEADAQLMRDEKAAEAAAIDEEIAFDAFAVRELYRGDEAVFAAQFHVDDFAFGAPDAAGFGE